MLPTEFTDKAPIRLIYYFGSIYRFKEFHVDATKSLAKPVNGIQKCLMKFKHRLKQMELSSMVILPISMMVLAIILIVIIVEEAHSSK